MHGSRNKRHLTQAASTQHNRYSPRAGCSCSCWVTLTVHSGELHPRYFALVSRFLIGYQPYRSLYERYVPYSDFSRLRLTPATEVAAVCCMGDSHKQLGDSDYGDSEYAPSLANLCFLHPDDEDLHLRSPVSTSSTSQSKTLLPRNTPSRQALPLAKRQRHLVRLLAQRRRATPKHRSPLTQSGHQVLRTPCLPRRCIT